MKEFAAWQNFYVIVGSSAGALIGLQFVVVTLIASIPRTQMQAQAGNAFATPNIVHFGSVLLLSAALSVPWHDVSGAAILCAALGLAGVGYSVIVTQRMRSQTIYHPIFEDWLFYALLPLFAYAMLAVSAYESLNHLRAALFGLASAALLLLFVGIHNAWDAATYHVFVKKQGDQ